MYLTKKLYLINTIIHGLFLLLIWTSSVETVEISYHLEFYIHTNIFKQILSFA